MYSPKLVNAIFHWFHHIST